MAGKHETCFTYSLVDFGMMLLLPWFEPSEDWHGNGKSTVLVGKSIHLSIYDSNGFKWLGFSIVILVFHWQITKKLPYICIIMFDSPMEIGVIFSIPKQTMYGIFTYIYHKNQPNVGKYTTHGCYGIVMLVFRGVTPPLAMPKLPMATTSKPPRRPLLRTSSVTKPRTR